MEKLIKLTFVSLAAVLVATGALIGPSAVAATGQADSANDQVVLKRDEDEVVLATARDMTTADRSKSLDRSRDETGDGAGKPDRSKSLDRSRDRSGDHNTRDASESRDASGDQTSMSDVSDADSSDDSNSDSRA